MAISFGGRPAARLDLFAATVLVLLGLHCRAQTSASPDIDSQTEDARRPRCGNGRCESTETCGSCPQDCGFCPPIDAATSDRPPSFSYGSAIAASPTTLIPGESVTFTSSYSVPAAGTFIVQLQLWQSNSGQWTK